MQDIQQFTNKAKTLLENDEVVSSGNVVTLGYYPRTLPNPLLQIYTVVKPLKIEITENQEEGSSYNKVVRYTLGISLHKAEKRNPADLLSKFTAIVNAFEASNEFQVESAGSDQLKRDPDTNSIIFPGYLTFKMYY